MNKKKWGFGENISHVMLSSLNIIQKRKNMIVKLKKIKTKEITTTKPFKKLYRLVFFT